MAPELLIPAIRPRDTDWRAKVLVLEKGNITTTKHTKRLQKMVLMDKEGNKVLGLLWDGCTDLFRNSLSVFKTYYVGGATVSPIKDEYLRNSPGMTHQWTISRSTYICPMKDTKESITYPKLPYVTCTEMISSVGTDTRIDLFAVVLDVKPAQEKPVHGKPTLLQECIIMQQELRPMILTLWGSFMDIQGLELLENKDKYPILLAKNIIASTFTGLALATTPASFIAIDPDIPQATEFRSWVSEHMTIIKNTERTPTRDTFQSLLAFSPAEPVVRISDIVPDSKIPWVKIQMTIDKTRQQLTYTSCPKCMFMITATPGEDYYCFNCQCNQIAMLRCKVNASITDSSATVKVTMFDSVTEELLRKTTAELHSTTEQDTYELLRSTNTRLADMTFHVQLRAQRKKFNDRITRYTVQQMHFGTTDEASQSKKQDIPTKIQKKETTDNPPNTLENDTEAETKSTAGKRDSYKQPETKTEEGNTPTSSTPVSPLKKMKVKEV